jgi:succinoglycan biosynthesis transport protein ExoP
VASFDQQPLSSTPRAGLAGGTGGSVFATLRRRWLIILVTTLLVTAAAAAFAYVGRNKYQSTAQLLYTQTTGPDLNAIGLLPVAINADKQALDNVAFVSSQRVVRLTARQLHISPDSVQSNIAVSGGKTNDVVQVDANGKSPAKAARLANAYVGSAVTLERTDQTRRARAVIAALTTQLNAMSARDRNYVGSATTPGVLIRTRLPQLQALALVGNGSPQVIQPAYPPTSRSGNPVQTIVLGLLLGVLLGVGLALVREQADRRLRHAGDMSAAFDAPVLATIPRHRKLARRAPFAKLPPEVVQAFSMLQANLRYGQSKPMRSVLITSSRGQQGKTTVAWNLALTAVSSGLSVVFVDADLRRSTLASAYGLQPFPGLTEVLRGDVLLTHALQRVPLSDEGGSSEGQGPKAGVSQNGHGPVLSVLVAGSAPPDPSELLQSERMTELLSSLRQHYDLVIVDTPPIAQVADAIALLRRVDAVLVVASINSTRGPEAGRLRGQLDALDAPVAGIVANGGTRAGGYAYVSPQKLPV